MKYSVATVFCCLLAGMAGCSKSADNLAQRSESSRPSALPVAADSAPDIVVAAFLDALRSGDSTVAEQLLTPIAREQTTSYGLSLQETGSQAATYQIGDTSLINGNAHVNSRWTEYAETGQPINYDIAWVLKKQPAGWRVAGMITAFSPNSPPVFADFEDAEDLLAKWDRADEQLAESETPVSTQASHSTQTIIR